MNDQEREWCDSISVLGNRANRNLTWELAERAILEGVAGDFAECGVMSGGHPAIMAHVAMKHCANRRVHLYDSFDRFPQPGPDDVADYQRQHGVNPDREHGRPMNVTTGTLEQVTENMQRWGISPALLVYHKGWIQETLAPPNQLPRLALLRVDVDLYDSTTPIFKYLYPNMPSGAFIISDDWGEGPAAPCRVATIKALGYEPEVMPVEGQTTTVWFRKP